jgi:hypothetical protein
VGPPLDDGSIDSDRAKVFLVVSVLATFALYMIPSGRYVAYPLMLLSTLAHEMGHGVAALLTGNDFEQFQMWSDGSGLARWRGDPGRFARAFIAAGGLVGPAFASAFCFVLARRAKLARFTMGLVALGLILSMVLVVRNLFGLVFVGALAALFIALAAKAKPWVAQLSLLFLGSQLALSVFSRSDYLFTDVAEMSTGPMPSDVATMAEQLFLPYWFWGGVCGLTSLLIMAAGLWSFFRDTAGAPKRV